jgi:serine/threonine protein kinase
MFEMLTGRLPFEADSHTALAIKHMRETPPPVTVFNPAVPMQIERVISKVLAKEPAGRYRTADQFGRILTTYRDSSLEDTGPVGDTGPVRVSAPENVSGSQPVPEEPIAERKTMYYEPDDRTAPRGESIQDMPTAYPQRRPVAEAAPEGTDWGAIILSALALISLLGLIPLWFAVYLRFAG